jgi:hypothetical protein
VPFEPVGTLWDIESADKPGQSLGCLRDRAEEFAWKRSITYMSALGGQIVPRRTLAVPSPYPRRTLMLSSRAHDACGDGDGEGDWLVLGWKAGRAGNLEQAFPESCARKRRG